jgi:UDP-N-acetylmuramyl pentapeptide synthase
MDDLSFEEFEIEYKYLKAVIEGGMETKPDNVLIYADCYNAIVRSIKSAIDACETIPVTGKRIAILGDIEEGGEFSDNMHKDVIKYVQDSQFDILLTLGNRMKKAISGNLFRDSLYVQSFTSIADLSNKLKEITNSGDLVLLKASRASQLEKCMKIVWPYIYSDLSKAHKKNETGFNRRYLYY